MPKEPAFHSVNKKYKPAGSSVNHDNSACPPRATYHKTNVVLGPVHTGFAMTARG
jgi:hypothetical protein